MSVDLFFKIVKQGLFFAFGFLLLWFSIRDVDLNILATSIWNLDIFYIFLYIVITIFILILRSYRWMLLLPKELYISSNVKFIDVFSLNTIGYMSINLLPFRLGEFIRPYLFYDRIKLDIASGLACVVIERLSDFISMLILLSIVLLGIDLPIKTIDIYGNTYQFVEIVRTVFLMVALPVVLGLFGLFLVESFMYKLLHLTIGRFFSIFAHKFEIFCRTFMNQIRPLKSIRTLLPQIFLTFLIWFLILFTIYILFKAFGFSLGMNAAFTVLSVLLIGLLIPAPPMFVGNFEAFAIAGLYVYGIKGSSAIGYALFLHWLSFFITFFLGMFFLSRYSINFRRLISLSKATANKTIE